MTTVLLYMVVVLIWGSTWLAVKFQIGIVPPEVSVAYRIGIAAFLMFIWSLAKGLPLRFTSRQHLFMMLQGALIFSVNFFLFYLAAARLTTGLIAVVFSTASVMIVLLNCLISRRFPPLRYWLGVFLGAVGIGFIFNRELADFSLHSTTGVGLQLSLGGTFCFSLGSIVSARNRAKGFSACGNTAWAMSYGAGLLCLLALFEGKHFVFDFAWPYVASLTYLTIIGSVVAFAAYFALLERIRAEQAAYCTVLFPVVAMTLSTFFEGYTWTLTALLGVLLILAGNILVLRQPSTGTLSGTLRTR